MLAGDMDYDGELTSVDMLDIQRVRHGYDSDYWIFVPLYAFLAEYPDFGEQYYDNPLTIDVSTSSLDYYNYLNVAQDILVFGSGPDTLIADYGLFTGILRGDVDESAADDLSDSYSLMDDHPMNRILTDNKVLEKRDNASIQINNVGNKSIKLDNELIHKEVAENNKSVVVSFYLNTLEEISAFQLALRYDTKRYFPVFYNSRRNFDYQNSYIDNNDTGGVLKYLWYSETGKNIKLNSKKVIEIMFQKIDDEPISETDFVLDPKQLRPLVSFLKDDLEARNFTISENFSAQNISIDPKLTYFSNKRVINLSVSSPTNLKLEFNVVNVFGNTLASKGVDILAGENSIDIPFISGNGMYFATVSNNSKILSNVKFLVIP